MGFSCEESNGSMRPGAIVGGAFLLVLGGTMFLERSGLADVSVGRIIGPACLIIIGTMSLLENSGWFSVQQQPQADGTIPPPARARKPGALTGGFWLIGVGCWMLVSQMNLFGLNYGTSWPLLVILSGIIMLLRGVR